MKTRKNSHREYQTAASALGTEIKRARELTEKLQQLVYDQAGKAYADADARNSDKVSWGYPGNVAHVNAELQTLVDFLSGKEDDR